MTTISFLRYCGLLVAIAAVPIPLLLVAHVVERSECLWWFLSYLAVALVASRVLASSPSSRTRARAGPWGFRRDAADPDSS